MTLQHDYRRTKSGAPDRRTRAWRERQGRIPPSEIAQMIRLVLPAARGRAAALQEIGRRISAFREAHPELAVMEHEYAVALEANNEAVWPLFGLIAKLREQDPELAARWSDYLNGETAEEPR